MAQLIPGSTRLGGVVMLLALVLSSSSPATGQVTTATMAGRQFQPEFVRRDMRFFTEQLGLDTAQKGIVESLLRDYETSFAESSERTRERLQAMQVRNRQSDERAEARREISMTMLATGRSLRTLQESDSPNEDAIARLELELADLRQRMTDLRPRLPDADELERLQRGVASLSREWRVERGRLHDRLATGMQAVLNEEQLERWPAFERSLRRQKTLPHGRLAGESVDLHIILRELDARPDRSPGLQTLLDAYEAELDVALLARNTFLESARMRTAVAMMQRDLDTAMQIAAEEARLRGAVQSVNERFVEPIAGALGGPRGSDFRHNWRHRAFPRVYQPTSTERALRIALDMGTLSPDQREVIAAIRSTYLDELQPLNTRLARAFRDQEAVQLQRRLRRWSGTRFDPADDPATRTMHERNELDDLYRAQLDAMLTPEQVAALPKPPKRGGDKVPTNRAVRRFDLDGDGQISTEEREAARLARFRPRFDPDRSRQPSGG